MSKKETTTQGVGVFTVIGIVFIVLKLAGATEVATWSWWWVTAPFWLPLAVVLGLLLVIIVGIFVAELIERR